MHCRADTGRFCDDSDSDNCSVWPGDDCRVRNLQARGKYKEQPGILVPYTSVHSATRVENETVADSHFHQVSLGWDCTLMSLVWPFPFANLWTVTQHSC